MNFSALARIPFQAVLAVCDALVESDAKRQARMLSRMYPDMDALNEIEGEIESHEPAAPYLSWGTKEPDYSIEVKDGSPYVIGKDVEVGPLYSYCNRCGYPHSTETRCLRDGSISFKSYDSMSSPGVPPPGAGLGGEVEPSPPIAAPSSPGSQRLSCSGSSSCVCDTHMLMAQQAAQDFNAIASSGGVTQLYRVIDLVNSGASPERVKAWCEKQIEMRTAPK